VLEETDLSGTLQNEYVFFGGKRVARYSAANGYSYYFSDHLGSADVVTDATGNIKEESDYYPFGVERIITDSGIGNNYKFTGKERDPETGCDYFGARYYCNPIGRFITPDWAAKPTTVPYANFGNPQSLNLYSYVQNNPTTMGDPDGHVAPNICGKNGQACKQDALDRAMKALGEFWDKNAINIGFAIMVSGEAAANEDPEEAEGDEQLMMRQQATMRAAQSQEEEQQQESAQQQGSQSTNYQPNPKHDNPNANENKPVSPQPKAGGSLQDQAVGVNANTKVAVDRSSGKFVVYRTDANGQTHGYETDWAGLRNNQRAALQKAGLATQRGKIIQPKVENEDEGK
jgi:RHS repeat-associated protein